MDQITQTLHCSNKSDLVHDSEDYPGEPIKVISTSVTELFTVFRLREWLLEIWTNVYQALQLLATFHETACNSYSASKSGFILPAHVAVHIQGHTQTSELWYNIPSSSIVSLATFHAWDRNSNLGSKSDFILPAHVA